MRGFRTRMAARVGAALAAMTPSVPAAAMVDLDEIPEGTEPPAQTGADTSARPAELESHRRALAPFGDWIHLSGLGDVWRPSPGVVGADFRPYATGGRWLRTDAGWSFDSDWSWGAITFHYGRWWFDSLLGWVWVPGSAWAPAWVDWRTGGGFVGWAPRAPPGFSFGVSLGFGFSPWCFVPSAHFLAPRVVVHAVPAHRVRQVFVVTRPARQTFVVGGVRIHRGPPAHHVHEVGRPHRTVVVPHRPPRDTFVVRPGRPHIHPDHPDGRHTHGHRPGHHGRHGGRER